MSTICLKPYEKLSDIIASYDPVSRRKYYQQMGNTAEHIRNVSKRGINRNNLNIFGSICKEAFYWYLILPETAFRAAYRQVR